MLRITPLSPRAYEAGVASPITAEEMRACLDRLEAIVDTTPRLDFLTHVRGPTQLGPEMFIEELRHLALLFRLVRALERVAVVADEGWIRAIAKVESHLIFGLDYEVFTPDQLDHARAWVLRQTDSPHLPG